MDLTDIYRVFYPVPAQYTFFLSTHGTVSIIDHILGQKAILNKYKKIEIIPLHTLDHNGIKQN
jgi:exonuclease III